MSEYCFLSILWCPFTVLFIKWTQHEKGCYHGSTCKNFCSINNTALFDNWVNITNASDQNLIVWQAFQTICLPSFGQGASKYTYFSLLSPKSARHICYRKTMSQETTKFGGRSFGSDVLGSLSKRNSHTWMNYFIHLCTANLILSVLVFKGLSKCLTSLAQTEIVRTQIKIFFQWTENWKAIIHCFKRLRSVVSWLPIFLF